MPVRKVTIAFGTVRVCQVILQMGRSGSVRDEYLVARRAIAAVDIHEIEFHRHVGGWHFIADPGGI